jgi:hypothetical protein
MIKMVYILIDSRAHEVIVNLLSETGLENAIANHSLLHTPDGFRHGITYGEEISDQLFRN